MTLKRLDILTDLSATAAVLETLSQARMAAIVRRGMDELNALDRLDRCAQMVVTAFRFRDEGALIEALRALEREACRQEEAAMQSEEHEQSALDAAPAEPEELPSYAWIDGNGGLVVDFGAPWNRFRLSDDFGAEQLTRISIAAGAQATRLRRGE